ncbi:MAG: molybdopterin molybdenumtransferase MoeA, partial [Bacteroidota bacterium]|nr:molybdopterin molybdenumtransferase MoeA [Bacteroidota bacterium]
MSKMNLSNTPLGDGGMISVIEAKQIILKNIITLSPVKMQLLHAAGMVLAEDVHALVNIPAYDQSSMDGYAFSFYHWKEKKSLKIKGEMAAGSSETFSLSPENAVRIFTGAGVPPGADTVVMQEKIKIENNYLIIEDENIQHSSNVRAKGSEIKADDLALAKETLLMPAAIGFLAGVGITEVLVYP